MFRNVKLILATGVMLGLGMTGVASAADMAVKARPVAAPIMYNWTGCYLGANVGGGWSRTDTNLVVIDPGIPANAPYGRETASSVIGGGQVGCDFMAGNNLVF